MARIVTLAAEEPIWVALSAIILAIVLIIMAGWGRGSPGRLPHRRYSRYNPVPGQQRLMIDFNTIVQPDGEDRAIYVVPFSPEFLSVYANIKQQVLKRRFHWCNNSELANTCYKKFGWDYRLVSGDWRHWALMYKHYGAGARPLTWNTNEASPTNLQRHLDTKY